MKRGDDALSQLFKVGFRQALPKLRLPDQKHLQQRLSIGLEVGQHAQLFERFVRQALDLVDDDQSHLALMMKANQLVLQSAKQLRFAAATDGQAELRGDQP